MIWLQSQLLNLFVVWQNLCKQVYSNHC